MHALSCLLLTVALAVAAADVPDPSFYLPLDGDAEARIAVGSPTPQTRGAADDILAYLSLHRSLYAPGKVGMAYDAADTPLVYQCAGNFHAEEGSAGFWLSPHFEGSDHGIYCTFFGAADWGMVYKYLDQSTVTFATARPDKDLYYDCGSRDIGSWKPGQWHHVGITWSHAGSFRRLYLDGKLQSSGAFPFSREVKEGPLFVGAGCTLYPTPVAHARFDEFALWDRPLSDEQMAEVYDRGRQSLPLVAAAELPLRPAPSSAATVQPVTPRALEQPPAPVITTPSRLSITLDGWWAFLPAQAPVSQLPSQGWGLARVPGYWTAPGESLDAAGKPLGNRWLGNPFTDYRLAYYQRTFTPPTEWKGKPIFLAFEGVDGLAQILLNGQPLAWLLGWEYESYDVTDHLRWGEANTLTVVLHTRGDSPRAGIYGSVSLQAMPDSLTDHLTVQPLVESRRIRFSCDLWHGGAAGSATLRFIVTPHGDGGVEKHFLQDLRLDPADRSQPTFSSQCRRVEATFDWPEAHLWNLDDPYLYDVRVELLQDNKVVDEAPPVRFGYREFTRRGSDFYLNGKPVHLRGHQIDLAWASQMEHVKELKAAGMNAFELSGPISHSWYAGTRYQRDLFEQILNYAEETGLIAIPILPDAMILRDRLFDPEVPRLYRHRVENHLRQYGNHASIGLWFMHFNLAGYQWYVAPSKIDGSHKPTDAGFQAKERFALEAERIAESLDPRPLYHHACGNFGDMFTANVYLGPNQPLQEREEWPLRWAEKRPFPLVACEHCCYLIPYWFRPRQFPLSVVYAGEPIFDEISAQVLGPRAYRRITPELFDLYDMGRTPRGGRLQELIRNHPGYQEVKSLVARRSLRSWRAFGVSGIIFNAINWDFKDAQGKDLPVMKALARYFGDTDLFIAGPPDNWPSKDHAFRSGETVRKQVVLLNDLNHDVPVTLNWRLVDAAGNTLRQGTLAAVAGAGETTFCPIEFAAPRVTERTEYRLQVEPATQPATPFLAESMTLQVFPEAQSLKLTGQVALFDESGKTREALSRLGVTAEALDESTDLSGVSLLVVGRESWSDRFLSLARKLGVEQAVQRGMNLLVLEQSGSSPCGLPLEETSTRDAFVTVADHPFLSGLTEQDLADLRGESDLIAPYPDARPETERSWPKHFHKWGNRGVLATFVYPRPHYAPFVPVLSCGFDLAQSPLLEGRLGAGRVALCQVGATARTGTDPVSTILLSNLLQSLSTRGSVPDRACWYVGESARTLLKSFGIEAQTATAASRGVIVVGTEPCPPEVLEGFQQALREGTRVVLMPGSSAADSFGLQVREERLFAARSTGSLPPGLHDGDLFLKNWVTLETCRQATDWTPLTEPGILAERKVGAGRLLTCSLDPVRLGATRERIKALRVWNQLLADLGAHRTGFESFLSPQAATWEPNTWETIPPYMNW